MLDCRDAWSSPEEDPFARSDLQRMPTTLYRARSPNKDTRRCLLFDLDEFIAMDRNIFRYERLDYRLSQMRVLSLTTPNDYQATVGTQYHIAVGP